MLGLNDRDSRILLETPLFAGMAQADLEILLNGSTVTEFPDGGRLFAQNDPADRFFLVLDGRVNLYALTEIGDQSIIEVFEAGLTFAEAAIFASGRFPLHADCIAGTRLLQIPAAPFLKHLSDNRGLAFKMLAALARWQRHLSGEIADQKSKSPGQRLGSFLLGLVGSNEGAVRVRLPLTKSELASRIGVTPESLSRTLGRLRTVGVDSEGRDITIADVAVLRRYCAGNAD